MSNVSPQDVAIKRISIDESLQARVRLDEETVVRYESMLRQSLDDNAEWPFPPLVCVFDLLVDGYHRFEAAKRVGLQTVPVIIHEGDREYAVRLAVGANANHGLARSRADVQRAILLASKEWPNMSSRETARLVGCSHQTVLNVRSRSRKASNVGIEKSGEVKSWPRVLLDHPKKPNPALERRMAALPRGRGLVQFVGNDEFNLIARTKLGFQLLQKCGANMGTLPSPVFYPERLLFMTEEDNPLDYRPLTNDPFIEIEDVEDLFDASVLE